MRRLLLLILALTVATSASVWWWSRAPVQTPQDEGWPEGFWRYGEPIEGDPEQLARLLSLPYAAGSQIAAVPGLGVVEHDRERTQPGLNLYVSGHASEVLLMDADGVLIHRWQIDFEDAFPDVAARPEQEQTGYIRRALLMPDGDLLVLWQGNGLARIDLRSHVKWALDLGTYNDIYYSEEQGSPVLLTIGKIAERRPSVDAQPILNDHLVWVDPDTGEIQRRISLLDALLASPWAGALEARPEHADILHANTVTILDATSASGSLFSAGQILFSLREVSLLGVLDPASEELVWALQGPPFHMQHEPVLLPGGRILLFDNQGAEHGSRAAELDLAGEILWSYPDQGTKTGEHVPVGSALMGTVQRLANGNTLIVASETGRAIEVTRSGEVVWRFETPHRAGTDGRFIAVLPQLERVPEPGWLTASDSGRG